MKKRHKILLGLMLAVTVAMLGTYIYSAVCYYKPQPLPSSLSLKDLILIDTLIFIPIYLGVLLLWFLGVKIAELIRRCK